MLKIDITFTEILKANTIYINDKTICVNIALPFVKTKKEV